MFLYVCMSNDKSVSACERGLCEIGVTLNPASDGESELTQDSWQSADRRAVRIRAEDRSACA